MGKQVYVGCGLQPASTPSMHQWQGRMCVCCGPRVAPTPVHTAHATMMSTSACMWPMRGSCRCSCSRHGEGLGLELLEDKVVGLEVCGLAHSAPPKVFAVTVLQPLQQPKLGLPVQVSHGLGGGAGGGAG